MRVISRRSSITSTITFTTRLDPNNSVDDIRTSIRSGLSTESCTIDVTPITPLISNVLNSGTALVDDEVSVPGEEGSESLDVMNLIIVAVA